MQEKEYSAEKTLKILQSILLDTSKTAKYAANLLNKMITDDKIIKRHKSDLPSESLIKKRIENVQDVFAKLISAKIKFEKTYKKTLSKRNRAEGLDYFFARGGQPNLSQNIAWSVGYILRTLNLIETVLMPDIKSRFESEQRDNINLSFLKKLEFDLNNHAKKTDQIIYQLLDAVHQNLADM